MNLAALTTDQSKAYALGVDDATALVRGQFVQPINVLAMAQALVQHATQQGLVLTIEQMPLKPLAQGNYAHQVSVRLANPNRPRPDGQPAGALPENPAEDSSRINWLEAQPAVTLTGLVGVADDGAEAVDQFAVLDEFAGEIGVGTTLRAAIDDARGWR